MYLWREPTAFREVSMKLSFHLTDVHLTDVLMSKSSVCEQRAAFCKVVTGETVVVVQFQKRYLVADRTSYFSL